MSEQAYTLCDIPLEQASLPIHLVGDVDQGPLLKLMRRRQKYSRSKLNRLAKYALAQGLIEGVKVRLGDGSIEMYVNQESFGVEFSAFTEKVVGGQAGLSRSQLRRIFHEQGSYKRKIRRFIHSNPVFLRAAEWFCRDLDGFINLVEVSCFRAIQNHSEIRGLLELVVDRRPKKMLEIGTHKGGSFYLLTKVADSDAVLVTVDLHIARKRLLKSFARNRQRVILIEADSTAPETIARIGGIFPEGVDFLFLDGDHSYEGVKKDFENYQPLVRAGGLTAFHDIVQDHHSRFGVRTGGWVGGVPVFWEELKGRFQYAEFIEHPQQDGRGIGVVFKP